MILRHFSTHDKISLPIFASMSLYLELNNQSPENSSIEHSNIINRKATRWRYKYSRILINQIISLWRANRKRTTDLYSALKSDIISLFKSDNFQLFTAYLSSWIWFIMVFRSTPCILSPNCPIRKLFQKIRNKRVQWFLKSKNLFHRSRWLHKSIWSLIQPLYRSPPSTQSSSIYRRLFLRSGDTLRIWILR